MAATHPTAPRGVLAAALTPLAADSAPAAARFVDHCRWLLDNGCDGLGVLGTTGEAMSFSVAERRGLLDALVEAGVPPRRLIVGTGAAALPDAVELSAHAAALGCAGCLIVPPFYLKPVSEDGLFAAYAGIIDGAGDDRLRVFLYHFPQMSGIPIPRAVIARLADAFGNIVAGLKDSSGDLDHMTGLARDFPALAVYSGTERYLLPILEAGGAGCISAGANVTAPVIAALYGEWKRSGAGEGARCLQQRVAQLRGVLDGVAMIPAMKALIARRRDDPGWAAVRPPLVPLGDADRAAFLAGADAVGLVLP